MNLLVPKIGTGGSFYLIVIYFWNSKTISLLNFEFFVFMLVKQFWQYIMHLSLLTWGVGGESGEAGQRPGIWQREPTHRDGNFCISSDHRRHIGLEDVKYLVTSRTTRGLAGGLVTKDGGHCSYKDLWVFFCTQRPRRTWQGTYFYLLHSNSN